MAWPQYGLVKAEGRAGAVLDADRRSWRLAPRLEVMGADEAMREQIRELVGEIPEGPVGEVARFDLTTEREFDADEGLAVMAAAAALVPPRRLNRSYTAPGGRVQSVALVQEKSGAPVCRIYDKGIESGSHPAGERIRFEGQNRARSGHRLPLEFVAKADLSAIMAKRLGGFSESRDLAVAHPSAVVDVLAQRVAREELTIARAERLAGSIEFLRRYGRGIYTNDKQSARRLKALRDEGIAVTDHLEPDRVVPMSDLLRSVVEDFSDA